MYRFEVEAYNELLIAVKLLHELDRILEDDEIKEVIEEE